MPENKLKQYSIHLVLFIITFLSTTWAGAEWMTGRFLMWGDDQHRLTFDHFLQGMQYSVPLLAFLTAHEFGHYFTARFYKVGVSLPYYIPLLFSWILPVNAIGTMGAFIRIKEPLKTNKEFFDIGIAGPLAGFVVALGILWYGFTHLPPPEHIFTIHPEYKEYGLNYADYVYKEINPAQRVEVGKNLLFVFFEKFVAPDPSLVPNSNEIMHYPFLFAGYLALIFTAINLIPIGQLDGGHILYGLIGHRKHNIVSPALFVIFVSFAGIGLVNPILMDGPMADAFFYQNMLYMLFLYITFSKTVRGFSNILLLSLSVFTLQYISLQFFPDFKGNMGWLLFAFLIGRVLGVYHPPALYQEPLSTGRRVLGWITLIIFALCFTPYPFLI